MLKEWGFYSRLLCHNDLVVITILMNLFLVSFKAFLKLKNSLKDWLKRLWSITINLYQLVLDNFNQSKNAYLSFKILNDK